MTDMSQRVSKENQSVQVRKACSRVYIPISCIVDLIPRIASAVDLMIPLYRLDIQMSTVYYS